MGAPTQYSAVHLISEAKVNPEVWSQMLPEETITRTVEEIRNEVFESSEPKIVRRPLKE